MRIVFVLAAFILFANNYVMAGPVEFSATAIQQFPQGPEKIAQMNVGHDGVRREYYYHGQVVVEIYRPEDGVRYMILPSRNTYEISKEARHSTKRQKTEKRSTNPCQGLKGEECRFLGKEKIYGRIADKWEVKRLVNGNQIRALVWVDVERGQSLRQFFPDGGIVELKQSGTEMLGGRLTEKWIIKSSSPDGQSETSFQWYDVELGIVIKEILPGGYVRELKDIKTGTQAKALFDVPAGYTQVESIKPD